MGRAWMRGRGRQRGADAVRADSISGRMGMCARAEL